MNTREQYLRDLAENYNTHGSTDSAARGFARFSITGSRRVRDKEKEKEKQKPKLLPEKLSTGALTWNVSVNDHRYRH